MNWLNKFVQKFQMNVEQSEKINKKIAVSALLIELMRIDGHLDVKEQEYLKNVLATEFAMEADEIEVLVSEAATQLDNATDYYEFTHVLNEQLSNEEKIDIVEKFWRMANSDGNIDAHEQHIIRKLANLLHLRRSEFIQSKENALKTILKL